MGPKITVDSATMANKGLEVIEARWLFDLPESRIDVVIHPQSVIHSMVTLADGSLQAQLSPPSMAYPIQECLLITRRLPSQAPKLDHSQALGLTMSPRDPARYPCLGLARAAATTGGTAPAVFNAANEVAVEAFVAGRLPFPGIAELVARTLAAVGAREPGSLEEVLAADGEARRAASGLAAGLTR